GDLRGVQAEPCRRPRESYGSGGSVQLCERAEISAAAGAPYAGPSQADRLRKTLETGLEPGEQRVVAGEHIVELRDRNRFRAVFAQKVRERVNLIRRAVQRELARDRRSAERRFNAEFSLGVLNQHIRARGKACPHL